MLDLPGFPLTGLFSRNAPAAMLASTDQRLLACSRCDHMQLGVLLDPASLYNASYTFRTGSSETARSGTRFFLNALETFAPGRTFACAIDIGCNDLYFLRQFGRRARHRVGIDPVWRDRQPAQSDADISTIGEMIEDCDLSARLPTQPDLIVLRHTLEHLWAPAAVLSQLAEIAAPDALFVIEVPGFDNLVARQRFDQVFHQHLQYFSCRSIERLVSRLGASVVGIAENIHDWGAICVGFAFTPTRSYAPAMPDPPDRDQFACALAAFRTHLAAVTAAIDSARGERVFGYGAAQMLPVLDYHLGGILAHRLVAVLDDDPTKDGFFYANLPLAVSSPDRFGSLAKDAVVLTAIDNAVPILRRLFDQRPRNIVLPFVVL